MNSARFVFVTDAPPLRETAFGNHGIAANLIRILGDDCALVVSHRSRRSLSRDEIRNASRRPTYLYPDSAGLGLKRFAPGLAELADIFGALLARRRIRCLVDIKEPLRLFVLVGGNGWFMCAAWLIASGTRLPLSIYLVDDLESSAALRNRRFLLRIIRPLERLVLRRAERVFTISQGYVEHLATKYGQSAEWLPAPMQINSFEYHPYTPGRPDVRHLVFVGGISDLYTSALVELYDAIQEFNFRGADYRLKLLLITTGGAADVLNRISNTDDLEVMTRLPRKQLAEICRSSWATVLPYSFDSSVKTLVSTSFSWKLLDSYLAGRPILVFGPDYASLPRYFREAGLPLCATSPEQLRTTLDSIEKEDSQKLITRYLSTWRHLHSPAAIRVRLGIDRPPASPAG